VNVGPHEDRKHIAAATNSVSWAGP